MRRIAIFLVALPIAIVAMLAAVSQSAQNFAPAIAAAAFPPNGSAIASMARLSERVDQQADPQAVNPPSAQTLALARKAYLAEPLAYDAIYSLARGSSQDKAMDTYAILQTAHGLTRRSTGLQMELLAELSKRNDDAAGFAVIDELLRRNTKVHDVLLKTLATAASNQKLLPSYRRLLAGKPPWADEFWRQLAQSAPGLANAAQIRIDYLQDGGKVDPEVDQLLVEGLAGQGLFDDAATLAQRLWPDKGIFKADRGIVRNSDFSSESDLLPFDWRLINTGDYGASIDPRGGTMFISAIAGARGPVAEQLVRLPGDEVRLDAKLADSTPGNMLQSATVSLVCLAPISSAGILYSGQVDRQAKIIETGVCKWAMLKIDLAVPSSGEGMEISLASINLTAVR